MARTRAGAELTRLHRQRQLQLRAATLRDMLEVWPAFNLDDIDGSWPPVEAALTTLVLARRRDSAGLAANYFRAYRDVEGVPGRAEPLAAAEPDPTLVRATLTLLGPIGAKKNIARGLRDVEDRTVTRLTGTVGRQVLQAGRDTLTRSVRADPRARGWQRITDGNPCGYCADIAAEGIVGADVDFHAHDHCGCTQEVAY